MTRESPTQQNCSRPCAAWILSSCTNFACPSSMSLGNHRVEQVRILSFLAVLYVNDHLTWDDHIRHISVKVSKNIGLLRHLSWFLPKRACLAFYQAYISPSYGYCDVVWHQRTGELSTKLKRLQNYVGRVILKKRKGNSTTWVRKQLGWPTLHQRRQLHTATQVFKCLHDLDPDFLVPLRVCSLNNHNHGTRSSTTNALHLLKVSSNHGQKAFSFCGPKLWNTLPPANR